MFFRTVSMISQNLLDQLIQNFKYAFSTCVTIVSTRISQKVLFFIFFRASEVQRKHAKIDNRTSQGIATFLITNFFLLFWYLL